MTSFLGGISPFSLGNPLSRRENDCNSRRNRSSPSQVRGCLQILAASVFTEVCESQNDLSRFFSRWTSSSHSSQGRREQQRRRRGGRVSARFAMVNMFTLGWALMLVGWIVAVSGLWAGGGRVGRARLRAAPSSTRPFPVRSMTHAMSPLDSSPPIGPVPATQKRGLLVGAKARKG